MIEDAAVAILIKKAREAQQNAYAPYSHFSVGAAVLTEDTRIYTGCNVENASYGLTMCAERNAIYNAVAGGCRVFRALALVGTGPDWITPCGACRQVMEEFHIPEIILTKSNDTYKIVSLRALLPHAFGL
ncbi:cytidine deaminase [Megasphaera paucivorans]|uniref:Cytidine deaminase n=1 Tax=Megasphaera paucivorans TaxID=349095 RepID=A0A1G9S488_9FIRM|nr:cytidine deaminase [Megasphaera paucivorans]SDM30214.1 cytidine deaminase [Megasphaera paucivorans]